MKAYTPTFVELTQAEITSRQATGTLPPSGITIHVIDGSGNFVEERISAGASSQPSSGGGASGVGNLPAWQASKAYDAGFVVRATVVVGTIGIGDLIQRNTAGTSGASFDATEAGNWTELVNDPDVVLLTGDQTVAGKKTFSTLPEVSADATTANQLVRKSQHDTTLSTKASKTILKDRDTVTNGLTGRQAHLRSDALTAGALPTWNDESGTGNNFTGTGTAQPTVTASAIGTHAAVRFDGTNDVVSRLSVDIGTSWTIAALVRTGASLSGQILSDEYPNNISYTLGLNTTAFLGGTANAFCVGTFNGAWSGAVAPTIATVNTTYLITATRTQGGNFVLRINGVQVATAAAGGAPGFEPTGNLYIGKRWDNVASPFWNGDIGEVQLFNRVLTADELQVTEGMLAWKYGQQALLPTTHNYVNDAPAIVDAPVVGVPVVNNTLTSTSTTEALSAARGKDLKDTADTLATTVAGKANTSHTHVKADVGLANVDNTADTAKPVSTAQQTALDLKEATVNKGAVNGYAGLDAGGRVPQAQLPTLPFGFELIDPVDIIPAANLAIFLQGEGLTAGAIAAWANPGTGGDFAQATGGSQPVAELVPTLGGRMAVKFDGTDDWMSATSISLGTRYGLFAVIRTGGAITANGHILSKVYPNHVDYSLNAGSNFDGDGAGTGFAVGHYNGAWRGYGNGTVPVINTPYIFAGMYDGVNFSLSINGATATTQAETSSPTATETTATMLGRRWDGTVTAANIWNGHIAALVCKSGAAFTADELAKLQGWASWFYGMASVLPAGHAYKNFPPLIAA